MAAPYRSIFLVDDDLEDQEIFIDAVGEIDSSILCFGEANSEEALKALNERKVQRPDLIFLDMNMPRINGKQWLERLKTTEGINDIPVIMCSTFFGEQDINDITKLGAAHYLVKPTNFDQLRQSIRHILARDWR